MSMHSCNHHLLLLLFFLFVGVVRSCHRSFFTSYHLARDFFNCHLGTSSLCDRPCHCSIVTCHLGTSSLTRSSLSSFDRFACHLGTSSGVIAIILVIVRSCFTFLCLGGCTVCTCLAALPNLCLGSWSLTVTSSPKTRSLLLTSLSKPTDLPR